MTASNDRNRRQSNIRKRRQQRTLSLEKLVPRELMAGDVVNGWQNTDRFCDLNANGEYDAADVYCDVNGDGRFNPRDLLAVVEEIVRNGQRVLPDLPAGESSAGNEVDVNADGRASVRDVLVLAQGIQQRAPLVEQLARLKSDGLLLVDGTASDDHLQLRQQGPVLQVFDAADRLLATFATADVRSIRVRLSTGNDRVTFEHDGESLIPLDLQSDGGTVVHVDKVALDDGRMIETTRASSGNGTLRVYEHGILNVDESYDRDGRRVRTVYGPEGSIQRIFQDDVLRFESARDGRGGLRETTFDADGTQISKSFQDGKLIFTEELLADGDVVRTAFGDDGTLRQIFRGTALISETATDSNGRRQETSYHPDGSKTSQTFQGDQLLLTEQWQTDGRYVRTAPTADGELQQIYQNEVLLEQSARDQQGRRRVTTFLDDGTEVTRTFDNDVEVLTEEVLPNGQSIRTAFTPEGTLRQVFQGATLVEQSLWDDQGRQRDTTYVADGTVISNTFENGMLVLTEVLKADGSEVRTAYTSEGILRQTFQDGVLMEESAWDIQGRQRDTKFNADGTKVSHVYQDGTHVLTEQWLTDGTIVRTTYAEQATVKQTYRGATLLAESIWDRAGGQQDISYHADGRRERHTFEDGKLVLSEEWLVDGQRVVTAYVAAGTLRRTYRGETLLAESVWDKQGGQRDTTFNADGSKVSHAFQDGELRVKEEWSGNSYTKTVWDDQGRSIKEVSLDGKLVRRDKWADDVTQATIWQSDKKVEHTWVDGQERARKTWRDDHYEVLEWDGQGRHKRSSYSDGKEYERYLSDSKTGTSQKIEFRSNGSRVEYFWENNTLRVMKEYSGKTYVKTSWGDQGKSMKETYSNGKLTRREKWAGKLYQDKIWDTNKTVEHTYENGSERIRKTWVGNTYKREEWDGKGRFKRSSFTSGRENERYLSDSNTGLSQRIDFHANGDQVQYFWQNGALRVKKEWSGKSLVSWSWDGQGRSMKETYSNGKITRRDKWLGNISQATIWYSNKTVEHTWVNGQERVRKTWQGNTFEQSEWDGQGRYKRSRYRNGDEYERYLSDSNSGASQLIEWHSDGSQTQNFWQNGKNVHRKTWDSKGRYREYSWGSNANKTVSAATNIYHKVVEGLSSGFGLTGKLSLTGAMNFSINTNFSVKAIDIGDFKGLDFPGLDFKGLDFKGLNFSGLDFSGLDFKNLDFKGLEFDSLNFSGLDFSGLDFKGFASIGDWASDRWAAWDAGFDDLGDWATERWKAFEGGLGDLGDWGTERWKSLEGGFGDVAQWGSERWDALETSWEDLQDFVNGGWKDFDPKQWAEDRLDSFENGLNDLGEWATERWKSLEGGLSDLGDWATHAWNALKVSLEDLRTGLADWWKHVEGFDWGFGGGNSYSFDRNAFLVRQGYNEQQIQILTQLLWSDEGLQDQYLESFQVKLRQSLGGIYRAWIVGQREATPDAGPLLDQLYAAAFKAWLDDYGFEADGSPRGRSLEQAQQQDQDALGRNAQDQARVQSERSRLEREQDDVDKKNQELDDKERDLNLTDSGRLGTRSDGLSLTEETQTLYNDSEGGVYTDNGDGTYSQVGWVDLESVGEGTYQFDDDGYIYQNGNRVGMHAGHDDWGGSSSGGGGGAGGAGGSGSGGSGSGVDFEKWRQQSAIDSERRQLESQQRDLDRKNAELDNREFALEMEARQLNDQIQVRQQILDNFQPNLDAALDAKKDQVSQSAGQLIETFYEGASEGLEIASSFGVGFGEGAVAAVEGLASTVVALFDYDTWVGLGDAVSTHGKAFLDADDKLALIGDYGEAAADALERSAVEFLVTWENAGPKERAAMIGKLAGQIATDAVLGGVAGKIVKVAAVGTLGRRTVATVDDILSSPGAKLIPDNQGGVRINNKGLSSSKIEHDGFVREANRDLRAHADDFEAGKIDARTYRQRVAKDYQSRLRELELAEDLTGRVGPNGRVILEPKDWLADELGWKGGKDVDAVGIREDGSLIFSDAKGDNFDLKELTPKFEELGALAKGKGKSFEFEVGVNELPDRYSVRRQGGEELLVDDQGAIVRVQDKPVKVRRLKSEPVED